MSEDWKKKLSFITPTYTESKVAGKMYKFYPVSIEMAFKLRRIGKGLAKALAVLFSSNAQDALTKDKTITNKEGFTQREVTIEAITPAMAKFREDQKAAALEEAIDAFLSEESADILADLIIDSLREEFPRNQPRPNPQEFRKEVPLPQITELLMGVARANKDVLGPLAQKAGQISESFEKAAQEKIKALAFSTSTIPAPAPDTKSESPKNPQPEATLTTG